MEGGPNYKIEIYNNYKKKKKNGPRGARAPIWVRPYRRYHSGNGTDGLVASDFTLATCARGLITEDAILSTDVSGPVIGVPALTLSSNGLVTRPLAPATSILSYQFWWFV